VRKRDTYVAVLLLRNKTRSLFDLCSFGLLGCCETRPFFKER